MFKFKALAASLVVVAAFGASACMAQQQSSPSSVNAMPMPTPPATQMKRCQDISRFAQSTAVAREAGESEQHYIGRLGLNMLPANSLGLIHQRLDRNISIQANPKLVSMIYSSEQSPAAWQKQTLAACEKSIS